MQIGIAVGIIISVAGLVILAVASTGKFRVRVGSALFSIAVLCVGASLLLSQEYPTWFQGDTGDYLFRSGPVAVTSQDLAKDDTLDVLFSSVELDLRALADTDHVKIDVVFGSAQVLLPENGATVVVSTAFSNVETLGESVVFADGTEYNINRKPDSNSQVCNVTLDCVFGSVQIAES
ncbi:MAG: hypothetical protein PHD32_06600 [Eubacteriales bacterium]|nr:hypothetical protein [Eubacteriales bacterium]